MGTEYHRGITRDNTYTQIPSLFPWIGTVFQLIFMKIEGHHSQRNTHFLLYLPGNPSLSFVSTTWSRKTSHVVPASQKKQKVKQGLVYFTLSLLVNSKSRFSNTKFDLIPRKQSIKCKRSRFIERVLLSVWTEKKWMSNILHEFWLQIYDVV